MKRPLVLLVAVATVVTVLALVMHLLRPPAEYGADEIPTIASHRARVDAASADPSASGSAAVDLAAPLEGGVERAAAPDPDADTGPRVAIEGRVIPPPDCAADPRVEVVALSHEASIDDALRSLRPRGKRGQSALNVLDGTLIPKAEERVGKDVLARAQVDVGGAFRLEVPESAGTVHVIALGRSWFSSETQEFAVSGTKRLELVTQCGAWIEGVVAVPSSSDVGEVEGLRVELDTSLEGSTDSLRSLGGLHRYAAVHEGAFEFPALPADAKCDVSGAPARLAASKANVGDLAPGRARRVELVFQTGGTIRGIVHDTTGAPVVNALVSANQKGRWFGFDDKSVRSASSAADGRFELVGVAVGAVEVKAVIDGYLPEKPVKLDVVDTAVTEGVELVLGRGGIIAGSVHWSDGSAAVGIDVEVSFDRTQMAGMGAFGMLKGAKGAAKTNADGRFVVTGLGTGPFVVEVSAVPEAELAALKGEPSADPDFHDPRTGAKLRLKGLSSAARREREHRARIGLVKPNTEGLEVILQPPSGIRGRVVDSTGGPVTAFKINAHGVGTGMLAEVGQEEFEQDFKTEDGSFLLQGVHTGKWKLRAESVGFSTSSAIEFDAPLAVDAPEFVIALERAATVRGIVVGPDGTPIQKATVSIDDGSAVWARAMSGVEMIDATSGEDGSFVLTPLRPGTTTIVAARESFARSTPLVLDLEPGQIVEGTTLRLTIGGRITGEVFHEGAPAPGMMVQVQDMKRFSQNMTHTDGKGHFEVTHLDPGNYQVIAMPSMGESLVGESGELDTSSMLSNLKMTTAEVVDGAEVHVVLGAPPEDPVHVKGTITMAGEPLASATVMFLPDSGKKGGSMFKPVVTKKDGTYAVTLDGPGGYSVSVQRMNAQMTGQSVYEERRVIPRTEDVVIDVQMPEGRISGRVLGVDGKPAANTRVSIVREGSARPGTVWGGEYNELRTDEAGEYDATGIAAGTYTVMAGGTELAGMATGGSATGGREIRPGVSVGEEDWRRGVDFRLKAPASVQVLVVDESGRPVSGAVIFARDENGRALDLFSFVTTDAAGVAKYGGLAPGRYSFRARTSTVSSRDSALVRVDEGGQSAVKLDVEKGTIVIVKVVDGDKNPLVAGIEVLDENGHNLADQVSLEEVMERFQGGGFDAAQRKFGPFAAGKYKVRVTSESGKTETKTVTLSGQAERKVTLALD